MKVIFLCTFVCCMQASAKVFSQEAKINVNLENVGVAKALRVISHKSDYRFLYNNDLLPKGIKVSVAASNKTVTDVMKDMLASTGLSFKVLNHKLIAIGYPITTIQQVTGTVTDSSGTPLVGVTIQVKGTTSGTVTGADGSFTLNAPDSAVLVVSYIGYLTKEIPMKGQTELKIILSRSSSSLDEVVVVGYGTQKKSDLTGSVASVNMKKAEAIPTTNVAEMLRGRAAGVRVDLVDPRPGGTSNILIRGQRSILGGNAPLFIVDGVPVNDINDINAEDIASIEVLKDASAQAIYGARASNGVILVTTKRGEAGKIQVNYHGYYTIQKLTRNFDLYSPEEFAQLRREAHRTTNDNEYLDDDVIFNKFERESLAKHQFANWEDLILRNAKLTSHNLSIRGGTDKSKIYSSVRYFDQNGLIPSSGYKRGTFRLNLDQTISDKISIQADLNLLTDVQNIESSNLDFITISPLAKAFNDDGTLNKYPLGPTSTLINPLWNIRESTNQIKDNAFNINLVGNYHILKNLSYKLNTALRRSNANQGIYLTREHGSGQYTDGKATLENSLRQEFLIENIMNYDFQLGSMHQFDITAMQSVNQINYTHTETIGTGFTNDVLGYDGLTDALNKLASRDGYQRRLLSYMGRIRYNLNDKYLFTFTGRSDGSSVFAASKKRGFFPSAAFAWKINNEPFLRNNRSIDQLKLRLSYGSIGNEAIDPYQTLGIASSYPYVFGGTTFAGNLPGSSLPNPNLTWETSSTFNVGLDFSFLQSRLTGSIEYYDTHTRDLLVDVSLAGTSGYSSTVTNGGESENNGIEAILTANILRNREVNWSITGTVARNRNKILKAGLVDDNGNSKNDIARNRFVGQPITVIYEKKFDGIFQTQKEIDNSAQKDQKGIIPGDVRVVDVNHSGTINDSDNVVFRAAPSWYGSLSTTFSFKGFDLLADLYVVEGAKKLNPFLSRYENGGTLQGSLNGIKVPYWTPEHHSESYPRPQSTTQSYLYSLAVQDASYLRLRTLTLGYTLPSSLLKRIRINTLRVYITATNLFTITDYKSWSPEVNPDAFPDAKALTFGVNIGL